MKKFNKKIFLTYPITLMAAVVSSAKNTVNQDYQAASPKIASSYNNLEKESIFPLCSTAESEADSDILKMLENYIERNLGTVISFSMSKSGDEPENYFLECSKGFFRMFLSVDRLGSIISLDFMEEIQQGSLRKAA